jgi:hypothetical protein
MMRPARLDALTRAAIRSGSDKYGGHLYTPIYHELFAHLRENPLKLLEIGIGGYASVRAGGLSLKMWAEYFPFATIIGLDIEKKNLELPPRVQVVQGSQDDVALLARLSAEFGPFDIVIDDGSHIVQHMIASFQALYPLMADDAIYAIEDTQTSFLPKFGGGPEGRGTVFDLAHKVALEMHRLEGYVQPEPDPVIEEIAIMTRSVSVFRNIVVFRRGANTYPSNMRLDFANAEVLTVFDAIAAQDARDPSPTGVLSRINMLIWAGRHDEAEALAVGAADTFPRDLPLLFELKHMMEWANRPRPLERITAFIDGALHPS